MSGASELFMYLASTTPEFIVWVVALVFLLLNWRPGSKARLLALAALLIQIVSTPLFGVVFAVLPRLASSRLGMGGSGLSLLYRFASFGHSLLAAGAWALILLALFSALKAPERPPG